MLRKMPENSENYNHIEPNKVPEKKKYAGVMDFYASKLCSNSESIGNTHSQMLDVQDIWWPRNKYE